MAKIHCSTSPAFPKEHSGDWDRLLDRIFLAGAAAIIVLLAVFLARTGQVEPGSPITWGIAGSALVALAAGLHCLVKIIRGGRL